MTLTEEKLRIYDRGLATISALALIIAGFWTLWGFMQDKEKDRQARDKEIALRTKEINLQLFTDKKLIYYELCDAEAEIAACNSYQEVVSAQKHFRKLYVGRAHIIGQLDDSVNNQKIRFCSLLDKYLEEKPAETPFYYFGNTSLQLSDICSKTLDVATIYK